jgi:hypothetical protein
MITPVNPNAYIGWLGSMMNPASYGDMWKAYLSVPTQPIAPLAYPAPTVTPAPYAFNPFDPNTWAQAFTVPGMTGVPAGAPVAAPNMLNPFDPNAWAQIWKLPSGAAPVPTPAPAPAPAPAAK